MKNSEIRHSGSANAAWDEEYDLVVLGSGVAGLTSALVAAIEGMRTLLIEKSDYIGGTTARSSGSVWTPNNSYQRAAGVTGDDQAALEYLDALVRGRADRVLRETFVAAGPEMLDYLEKNADVRFQNVRSRAGLSPGTAGSGARRASPGAFAFRWAQLGEALRSRRLALTGIDAFWRDDGNSRRGCTAAEDHALFFGFVSAGRTTGTALPLRPHALQARHPAGPGECSGGKAV